MPTNLFDAAFDFPSRTTLFCLQPIGIGTCYVESLASYLCRLAHMHSVYVGTMMAEIIVPLLGNSHLLRILERGSSRIYERPSLYIGTNDSALRLVDALEHLTGCRELLFLTLLPWRHLIDSKGVLKEIRSWCPTCFEESRRNRSPIFEPLIWAVKFVSTCPLHLCSLLSHCPVCKRAQPLITRTTRPGYCALCKSWLGSKTHGDDAQQKISAYGIWSMKNIMTLLARTPQSTCIPIKKVIRDGLLTYIQSFRSASAFAYAFGIPRCTAKRWMRNVSFPSFDHLLQICYRTQTPLMKFLTTGTLNHRKHLKKTEGVDLAAPTKNEFDKHNVKRHLERILTGSAKSTISMSQVSRKLGISKRTLYRHFPELCRRIAGLAANSRKEKAHSRLKQECLFVEETCRQMHLADIYPSFDLIEAASPKRGILRAKEVKNTWHRTMKQLGLWSD